MQTLKEDLEAITATVFQESAGILVVPAAGSIARDRPALSACVHIGGAWNGAALVECELPLARRLTAAMFAQDERDLGLDDVRDAMGEIANMVEGNVKALLPTPSRLSLPTVVEGADYAVSIPGTKAAVVSFVQGRGAHPGHPDPRGDHRGRVVMAASVLVIDDSRAIRAFVRRALESAGFRVTEACDGEEALALVRVEAPDVILLDVDMPVLDGFGTMEALSADPTTSGIPVAFLTAHAAAEDAVTGLTLGARDYVRKPCPPAELVARLRAIVTVKARHDALHREVDTLTHLSVTDALTGLANRRRLDDLIAALRTGPQTADRGPATLARGPRHRPLQAGQRPRRPPQRRHRPAHPRAVPPRGRPRRGLLRAVGRRGVPLRHARSRPRGGDAPGRDPAADRRGAADPPRRRPHAPHHRQQRRRVWPRRGGRGDPLAADAAVYDAKRTGRNRVVAAPGRQILRSAANPA